MQIKNAAATADSSSLRKHKVMIVMYPMLVASLLFVIGLAVYIVRMNKNEKKRNEQKQTDR